MNRYKEKIAIGFVVSMVLFTVMAGAASADTLNLVEKDPNTWTPISGGNYGTLTYSIDANGILAYNFVVVDNDTLIGPHTLVVIAPETSGSDEWPQMGSIALSGLIGSADISGLLGNIDDGEDYDGTVYGAKIWYVPTADFDSANFQFYLAKWNPGNILFEEDLITPTPTPIPEFGTIVLPALAVLGLFMFFNRRRNQK